MEFNDYEWHDAILKNLNIDRNNPGYNDTILMKIEWPDETSSNIVFENVYQAIMELNFGAIGNDYIVEAFMAPENDKDLIELKRMWDKFDIGEIHCYLFNTTASGSKIKIMAKGFKVF